MLNGLLDCRVENEKAPFDHPSLVIPNGPAQPFPEAARQTNEQGIQVCASLGLPHDTPERLARTLRYLEQVSCSLSDLRILRIYPKLLPRGDVTEAGWLGKQSVPTNQILPNDLSETVLLC